MRQFEQQGGVAFFLIYYSAKDLFYYLSFDELEVFWQRAKNGGRKSFRFEELSLDYILPKKHGLLVPYLDAMQKDLAQKDAKGH